jgi:RimJ/RimL family protein N-acetyltransferase
MAGQVFLETESLELRTIEERDLDFLQELKNLPEVRLYHPEIYPHNMVQMQEWLEKVNENEDDIVLVIWKDDDRIGNLSLSKPGDNNHSAGTGISVHPDHQGNGYGTEAMEKLIDFGFREWNLNRVFSGVLEFNRASQKLWEKLGFEKEAVHRDYTYCNNDFQDLIEYGILRGEWKDQ